MSADRFADKVVRAVTTAASSGTDCKLTLRLDGPHGKPSLDVDDYDVLVLVAGGIGITPLLSLINRARHRAKANNNSAVEYYLHWVVRSPHELLLVEGLMFPIPTNVKTMFYVTHANESGHILCQTGDGVAYVAGRPVLDSIVNNERFQKDARVGVLACGPAPLVHDAEWHSHACGFDFHKEEFAF
ncbi:Aste57867_13945 [Aphanomyces stellatus]|uniref:Aste57867_13945 protein n=1 Tax=Aphanomyces stellatus TaxID=120398 RepID=A0A485L045_9STRA|nr:hypothetical protein As57867_013894 [Aphanomyces stellatus]VFT90775.1 Aste57867_13945 [Aphanomyces stellatus]